MEVKPFDWHPISRSRIISGESRACNAGLPADIAV